MAKWRVRKYVWSDYKGGVGYGKRTIAEEFIEAPNILLVDSALHFVHFSATSAGDPATIAVRAKGEWFAVDKIEDQQEASMELPATRMELTDEGWRVSHVEVAQPELA